MTEAKVDDPARARARQFRLLADRSGCTLDDADTSDETQYRFHLKHGMIATVRMRRQVTGLLKAAEETYPGGGGEYEELLELRAPLSELVSPVRPLVEWKPNLVVRGTVSLRDWIRDSRFL